MTINVGNSGVRDFPEGIDFFMAAEEPLERFAEQHDLRIRKYRQRQPVWEFVFLHPKGGVGILALHRAPPTGSETRHALYVASHWYVDDDSVHERRTKPPGRPTSLPSIAPDLVVASLEQELRRVVTWSMEELGPPAPLDVRPKDEKGNYIYSELERSLAQPKVDPSGRC